MFQTSSCDRKLPTHSKCHAEFWADFPFPFPFPLSLIFFLQSLFKSCCQNCLPLLLFWWHHSLPQYPLSLVSWSKLAFISLDCLCACLYLIFCLFLASFHQLLHRIVIFDVPVLRYRFIFTSNKESLPIPLSQTSPFLFQSHSIYICIPQEHIARFCLPGIVPGNVRVLQFYCYKHSRTIGKPFKLGLREPNWNSLSFRP